MPQSHVRIDAPRSRSIRLMRVRSDPPPGIIYTQPPPQQTPPVQQAPVMQQPVYQQPMYQPQPVYQQPMYQPQPVYQQPVYQAPPAQWQEQPKTNVKDKKKGDLDPCACGQGKIISMVFSGRFIFFRLVWISIIMLLIGLVLPFILPSTIDPLWSWAIGFGLGVLTQIRSYSKEKTKQTLKCLNDQNDCRVKLGQIREQGGY